ncbi:MAG: hypothetical protein H5T71_09305 [Chloroflexi bacterium]|nr:hypothetical protein [Chloroflexota bacterium]
MNASPRRIAVAGAQTVSGAARRAGIRGRRSVAHPSRIPGTARRSPPGTVSTWRGLGAEAGQFLD